MRIEITEATVAMLEARVVGEIIDAPEAEATFLISIRKARPAAEADVAEENLDPESGTSAFQEETGSDPVDDVTEEETDPESGAGTSQDDSGPGPEADMAKVSEAPIKKSKKARK